MHNSLVIDIIPAILTNDPIEVREKLLKLEGLIPRVQIDIIDGLFADNKTIEPSIVENIETELLIDYHLMVKEPFDWIERCIRGQADRIIGQIELMRDQVEFVEKVTEAGLKVGLAIDVDTPVASIDKTIITDIDVVLVMSVPAGFGGQEFDTQVLKKIEELDHIRAKDASPFYICDDGGISLENVDDVHVEGVDEVAIGKRLFDGDLMANITRFQKAAHGVE